MRKDRVDLILWRHAEAEDGAPDLERRLTSKGHKQAQRMADWLDRQLPDSCRVLVSPAVRAQQTAEALKRKFKTVEALAPNALPEALLAAVHWPDGREHVLIVGHQPTLGQLAAFLLAGEALPWSMRKGAVWWLTSRDRDGDASVALRCVMAPDFL
jgi:phosphohistidine phosphatase